ncbi:putative F-box domain, leucine-rich repeat domain superfamily, F-box-like domain superfamily [Helianthus annuus]|nr:putative F-box domain, leucine-rich repeat domain superfamily, F-box-like domain superfamily [Helianthus annuus]
MVRRNSSKVRRRARELSEDDRITRLPDAVIHHIFSFIDTRSVVQSSLLSRRWKNTWKSHPHFNFEIGPSPDQVSGSKFPNFTHRFLSKRDDVTELSTIEFRSNSITLRLLKKIILYAMSHKTRKLKIEFSGDKLTRRGGFDSSLLRSRYLQHLSLNIDFGLKISPSLTWDFPALTTLTIKRVTFTLQLVNDDASKSVDLFSRFPNLKTLALDDCTLSDIDTFIIKSSELESLYLIGIYHSCEFVVSAPKLSLFMYNGIARFSLSAKDLNSLNTVNFQTIYSRSIEEHSMLLELMIKTFQQLYKAKSLTINLEALKLLYMFPELCERRNCPFTSLQSLTVVSGHWLPHSLTGFSGVFDYFSRSSPALKIHIDSNPTPLRFRY